MKKRMNQLPLGFSAVALSLLIVGKVIGPSVSPNGLVITSGLLICLVLLKISLSFSTFTKEMENPVALSTFATFPMSLAVLASYLNGSSILLAKTFWLIGLVLHIVLMIKLCLLIFQSKKILPSFYVSFVGLVAFSVSSKAVNFTSLGTFCWWFGCISFIALTPFVIQTIANGELAPMAQPTKVIVAAPMSLLIVGYLSLNDGVNLELITSLYFISIMIYILGLYFIVRSIQFKPSPTVGAYTFPLAISTLSSSKMMSLYAESSFVSNILMIHKIQFVICCIIICFVVIQYIRLVFID